MPEPWDSEQEYKRKRLKHLKRCALLVIGEDEDTAQGLIMDYIIEHDAEVPLFMLNDVPTFILGYLAALDSLQKKEDE